MCGPGMSAPDVAVLSSRSVLARESTYQIFSALWLEFDTAAS